MENKEEKKASVDAENSFKWIHIQTNDLKKMEELQKEYELPDYIIESAQDLNEVSRMEYWDRDSKMIPNVLILRYPHKQMGLLGWEEFITHPIVIIVYKHAILTFTQTEAPFLTQTSEVRFRPLEQTDKDYFILSLIWNIGAEYIYFLDEINQRMGLLEGKLKKSTETNQLFGLMSLQKSLVFFESAIESNHPVIKKFRSIDSFTETTRSRFLLKQTLIEIEQAEKTVDQTNKLIDQISEVYSSAIGNNLNTVVKFLSSITIILSIPSIVGALWGMNVPVPFEKHPLGFLFLTLFSLVLTLLSVLYFYKKDFL